MIKFLKKSPRRAQTPCYSACISKCLLVQDKSWPHSAFVASDTNREMSEMSVSDVKILLIVRFSIQEPRSYVVADVAFCMLQHL